MSFTKTYFLCPTTDFIHPPPTGPLHLGSIIRSSSSPQYPLNKASIPNIPDPSSPIVETNWKKTVSASSGLGLGVYAQFLQLAVPLGPEVSTEHTKTRSSTFAFDTVTTLAFEPTEEYVRDAVQAPAVRAWLKEPKQRFAPVSELFIITGLKLVKGARIRYESSRSTEVRGNLGVDVPTLGLTVGPKGHWTRGDGDETEFEREEEFVFAFRVKRLRFGRRVKLEEYNKGAFMTIGAKEDEDEGVLVEDVDGDELESAEAVFDAIEDDRVYCVAP